MDRKDFVIVGDHHEVEFDRKLEKPKSDDDATDEEWNTHEA
jgi:hypothetical protein